jgi:hypothetical protein
MTELSGDIPQLVGPLDIVSASRAFLIRSGQVEIELRRRLLLRDTLRSSLALAHALEEFVKRAGAHYHGVHCTAHLDADVEAITRTLSDWSESVRATATLYNECREVGATSGGAPIHPPYSPGGIGGRAEAHLTPSTE